MRENYQSLYFYQSSKSIDTQFYNHRTFLIIILGLTDIVVTVIFSVLVIAGVFLSFITSTFSVFIPALAIALVVVVFTFLIQIFFALTVDKPIGIDTGDTDTGDTDTSALLLQSCPLLPLRALDF